MINARQFCQALSVDECEFKCKSRGVETCLHSRGAALNARETGILLFSYLPPVMMLASLGKNLLRSQYARIPTTIINAISDR